MFENNEIKQILLREDGYLVCLPNYLVWTKFRTQFFQALAFLLDFGICFFTSIVHFISSYHMLDPVLSTSTELAGFRMVIVFTMPCHFIRLHASSFPSPFFFISFYTCFFHVCFGLPLPLLPLTSNFKAFTITFSSSFLKGGESSSQFRWFTIAKIELQFLIFFVLILGLRLQRYSTNTKRCPPEKSVRKL